MQSLLKTPYALLMLALLLFGIELFIWYYLGDIGYLQLLVDSDKSHVSMLIILIYSLSSLWFLLGCGVTSRHYEDVSQGGPDYRHLHLRRFYQQLSDSEPGSHALLEVLELRLRSQYAFGFIIADLMLKLGILGTVIGFILMLGSLSNLNSVDITVMQTLLAEMSGGMKVALFTTLTGMLAGILLHIKFNFLDWAVDHLINDIREQVLAEVTSS
ncbi:MAG: MotA/TolQ/ExbB proton channel family protein [Gammaproteobacteria bacterium]|nr:MotA/TolQ/ExbB proton channel family protein [Gammaproteobacteria bacterium]